VVGLDSSESGFERMLDLWIPKPELVCYCYGYCYCEGLVSTPVFLYIFSGEESPANSTLCSSKGVTVTVTALPSYEYPFNAIKPEASLLAETRTNKVPLNCPFWFN